MLWVIHIEDELNSFDSTTISADRSSQALHMPKVL